MLTVGQPQASTGAVVSLTERRKRSYYRLAIVDNRLVGYLALGVKQPDSLAVKRLIDEGLSIQEIKKDLLRGEFDSQRFFSGKHTYTLQRWMTTGELPTPLPPLPEWLVEKRPGEPHATSQERERSFVTGREKIVLFQDKASQDPPTSSPANECLLACPALGGPVTIDVLNRETPGGADFSPGRTVCSRMLSVWGVCTPLPSWFASGRHDDVVESAPGAREERR